MSADVIRAFNTTSAVTTWRLGAWSDTTGHPATVAFFEQRFAAARTTEQPQTFWLSQSADLENMRPDSFVASAVTVEDDDALDFTIAADQVNAICWLSPGPQQVLGTLGGEWIVRSDGPVLTPTDIDVKRQTAHGGYTMLLSHNPQGEWCRYTAPGEWSNFTVHGDACRLRLSYIGTIFFAAWAVQFVPAAAVIIIVRKLIKHVRRRRASSVRS